MSTYSQIPRPQAAAAPDDGQQAARRAYTEGLRALADWLDATPQVPTPSTDRVLVPLSKNPAVEAFAAEHGLAVVYDDEGNASVDVPFGPLALHTYGYVDFEEHEARLDETLARRWAARAGMESVPAEGGDVR